MTKTWTAARTLVTIALAGLAVVHAGCDAGSPATPSRSKDGSAGDVAVDRDGSASEAGSGFGGTGGAGGSGGGGGLAGLCDRWRADRADMSEGEWSGSIATCDPGDMSSTARDNTMRLVNLFRWIAHLPPLSADATLNSKAQAAALMMAAQGTLSHTPDPSWRCYTAAGAEGAHGNLATYGAVSAVAGYMQDPGNETTMGHRRGILSNSVGPVGIGSVLGAGGFVGSYSCLWITGGSAVGGAAWTAWPPPGDFPIQAVNLPWGPLDAKGWTVQSDSIDLTAAGASVTDEGVTMSVRVVILEKFHGSKWAINIIPDGWRSQVGHTYHVVLTGVSTPITYDVRIVDCG